MKESVMEIDTGTRSFPALRKEHNLCVSGGSAPAEVEGGE